MKKGFTILELLISITLISIVLLLLLKIMMSFYYINDSDDYASKDEINRALIIKSVESDFLNYNLNGLKILKENNKTIIDFKLDEKKVMEIKENYIIYNDEKYELESNNAKYDLCVQYTYVDLDDDYYLIKINIPVLINGKNTTVDDDLQFTYIGLKNNETSYQESYAC